MIICIGAGPGDLGYLTQLGAKLIRVNRTFSDMSIMLIRTLN